MEFSFNKLAHTILHKDSLEQCSVQELEQLAGQYPYFSAVQLLFAKKLMLANDPGAGPQSQKLALYFYDPLWLDHILNDSGEAEILSPIVKEHSTEPGIEKDQEILQTAEKDTMTETIPEMTAAKKNEPAGELSFEPFHTVDYFASQGIKFREEERPADKLGQQLKSFTEWLKTMKRFPASEIAKTAGIVSEQKVEQLAEHSIEDREVITEAMAEVWEKQGNNEKAIAVYDKLSLLEPSKIAYFAAQIERLKKTN